MLSIFTAEDYRKSDGQWQQFRVPNSTERRSLFPRWKVPLFSTVTILALLGVLGSQVASIEYSAQAREARRVTTEALQLETMTKEEATAAFDVADSLRDQALTFRFLGVLGVLVGGFSGLYLSRLFQDRRWLAISEQEALVLENRYAAVIESLENLHESYEVSITKTSV